MDGREMKNRYRLLLAALVLTQFSACTAKSPAGDLFDSSEAALKFTASLGPDWQKPIVQQRRRNNSTALVSTYYAFHVGDQTGWMILDRNPDGHLTRYEVRFPIVDQACVELPDTRNLARLLLKSTEPIYSHDLQSIRRLGRIADLVWPYATVRSGPSTQFGETKFQFYKMDGYCSVRAVRLAGKD